MTASKRAQRYEVVRQHQRWGMLPPQTHGKGLVLFLLMIGPLAAALVIAVVGGWPDWGIAIMLPGSLAGIALNRHTNQWLDAQISDSY